MVTTTRRPSAARPNRKLEGTLLADGCTLVGGIDEVGRGAWAGPLTVGVTVVDLPALRRMPKGLRDSKALTPLQREQLFPLLEKVCVAYAIGHASPRECDDLGMTAAQRLATARAFAALPVMPDAVIMDGNYDFTDHPRVLLAVRADRTSLAVAAASVLAKVTRDAILVSNAPSYPRYGFERNKGYASREHRLAVREHGLTGFHRQSWAVAFEDPDETEPRSSTEGCGLDLLD